MMPSQTKEAENQPFLDNYSDEFIHSEDYHNNNGTTSHRRRIVSHASVFIITSLIWMLVWVMFSTPSISRSSELGLDSRHNVTSNAKLLECGNSPHEAKKLGCKYDVLLNNWVPEPCYDQEFVDEYTDDQSWDAYADEDLTQRIYSVKEMSEREYYYTSVRDHINHCSILWKKQFWVLFEERKAIDTMVASAGHTDHCALYLNGVLDRNPQVATKVDVGYAGCWIRE